MPKWKPILGGLFVFPDDIDKSTVKCIFCERTFKYHRSTSSLKYHVQNCHPTEWEEKIKADRYNNTKCSQLSEIQPNTSILFDTSLPTVGCNEVTPARSAEITDAITKWIAKSCLPVSICEDEGFKDLLSISTGNSFFTGPSRSTIQQRINCLFVEGQNAIKIQLAGSLGVALTCEHWSSLSGTSFLGLTVHYIDTQYKLCSIVVGCDESIERHTAAQVRDYITRIVEHYSLGGKVVAIIADNSVDMLRMTELADFISCSAHLLQLAPVKALAASGMNNLLIKARNIVEQVRQSCANLQMKEEHSETEEPLVQDVPTVWNSTLDMMESLLKHRQSVDGFMQGSQLPSLSDNDWYELGTLTELLRPIKLAAEKLGGPQYATVSAVLPCLKELLYEFRKNDDDNIYVAELKAVLTSELENMSKSLEANMFVKVSIALDPRYKKLKCMMQADREEVWENITMLVRLALHENFNGHSLLSKPKKRCYESSDEDDDEEGPEGASESLIYTASQAVSVYRSVPQIDDDCDPLQWWNSHTDHHPLISSLVKKHLCCPATSVPPGRLFTLAGSILSAKRRSITASNTNKLVSLSSWLQAQPKLFNWNI